MVTDLLSMSIDFFGRSALILGQELGIGILVHEQETLISVNITTLHSPCKGQVAGPDRSECCSDSCMSVRVMAICLDPADAKE